MGRRRGDCLGAFLFGELLTNAALSDDVSLPAGTGECFSKGGIGAGPIACSLKYLGQVQKGVNPVEEGIDAPTHLDSLARQRLSFRMATPAS
jgi:hypothetical protein